MHIHKANYTYIESRYLKTRKQTTLHRTTAKSLFLAIVQRSLFLSMQRSLAYLFSGGA